MYVLYVRNVSYILHFTQIRNYYIMFKAYTQRRPIQNYLYIQVFVYKTLMWVIFV